MFAAATPVSGQMKISGLTFLQGSSNQGFQRKNDDIVIHSAALSNISAWANLIGGYFPSDAIVSDTLKIDNYKSYITTKWNGGKSDIELFSIIDEGHGVNWYYIMPLMWNL